MPKHYSKISATQVYARCLAEYMYLNELTQKLDHVGSNNPMAFLYRCNNESINDILSDRIKRKAW